MSENGADLGGMLAKISENPQAREMLANLLGNIGETETNDSIPKQNAESEELQASESAEARLPSPPAPRNHSKGRRDMLMALRPYLGARRCASVDRMIRALELYEIIEETHLLKGGK